MYTLSCLPQAKEYTLRENDDGSSSSEPLVIQGGGRLVLGQDLDSEEGDFSLEQILACEIADFVIYDVVLTADEMKSFMSCKNSIPFEPIIYVDREMTTLQAVGDTDVSTIPERELCVKDSGHNILFPERVTFKDSVAWCGMLKGKVVLPANQEENIRVYDKFLPFRDACVDSWRTLYYFGAIRNTTTDKWTSYYDGNPIAWENFDVQWNKISNNYGCAAVASLNMKYTWYAIPCESAMCSACNFTSPPKFLIRGLCKTSLLDRTYYLNDYYNGRPLFEGEEHGRIFWNNGTWELRSRRHSGLFATMEVKNSKAYPFGRKTWAIFGDKCDKTKVRLLQWIGNVNRTILVLLRVSNLL